MFSSSFSSSVFSPTPTTTSSFGGLGKIDVEIFAIKVLVPVFTFLISAVAIKGGF